MTIGLIGFNIANPFSLLKINLIPDPNGSVNSAPAGFTPAVQAAALAIQNACPKTAVTLNIVYGYNTVFGGGALGASAASSDLNDGANIAYTTIRSAYISKATTPVMTSVANHLPNTTTLNGFTTLPVARSVQKALGLIPAVDSTQDGYIVIGNAVPQANWPGVILHELSQAMGRLAGEATFNFSDFTAAGTWEVSAIPGTAHYFSIDGGTTKLADYDTSSDMGDFKNGGVQDGANPDAFDASYAANSLQTLTTVDIQLLNALGFQ